MPSLALNNLWTYIEGLQLSKRNKKWLADKLTESIESSPSADQVKREWEEAFSEIENGQLHEYGSVEELFAQFK